ncbi:primosomal protein N' [Nocardioides sp.]|uniref:primosomal protein N' n=1 Tax=Nocardioides sp. TaxID=35761 RepID=UPI0035290EA4
MTGVDEAREPEAQESLLPGLKAEVRSTVARSRSATRQRGRAAQRATEAAEIDPVARVLVDLPLAHLDRPFDYLVPASMGEAAVPGCRVKVRFAGQDVDGFVVERVAESDHPGRLAPLRRVVSPEPVLTAEIAALSAELAERYAGTRSDVLRLAVPPRHATTEKQPSAPVVDASVDVAAARAAWSSYDAGGSLVGHLAEGGAPRAVWTAAPGEDWPTLVAQAAAATFSSGRGAVVCTPDHKDAERVSAALTALLGEGQHVLLSADSGPAARYRAFLAVVRGACRIVVGTRSAAFAPVRDLGLVVVWDDGDDLHAEPRAPYPHTREVLLLRARAEQAGALLGGFAASVEGAYLVRTGWAQPVAAARAVVRQRVTVAVAGATEQELARDPYARGARVPSAAYHAIRDGLETGPVLVQTPRAGYAPSLACERCRTPARCGHCSGPLRLTGPATPPACAWCGTAAVGWACPECGHAGLRAPVLGADRSAEELGRTFPQTTIVQSSGERVRATVPGGRDLVVATPGAEPVAAGGYPAVVLLDTWLSLARADLRTDEEALRRWMNAAGLVRPGGRVVAVGEPSHPALQALVRWDPLGFAEREIAERQTARLPPAARVATVSGPASAVEEALALLTLPDAAEILGPVPHAGARRGGAVDQPVDWRAVVRAPRAGGAALSHALREMQQLRSARKLDPVRVQVDPATL